MTKPGNYTITVYQGATFSRVFTWKDGAGSLINLTGYTARLQARSSVDSTSTLCSLTSAGGDITLGGAAGTITVVMSAATTAAITQSGVYDLELIDGSGNVTRLLEGVFRLIREVTR